MLPNSATFASRRVTDPNQSEVNRQRVYDNLLYPLTGATQLGFFATPIGQGITTALGAAVGSPKTNADTNLQLANQLPSGKQYLIETIEVYFWPGASAAANTFTLAPYGASGTWVAGAAASNAVLDTQTFYSGGVLSFSVLDKNQLTETPLRSFPPKTWLEFQGVGAVAVGGAVLTLQASTSFPNGRPYVLDPEISLQPATNFAVNLLWPGAVATPSGFNGRCGVYFDGIMQRASQ